MTSAGTVRTAVVPRRRHEPGPSRRAAVTLASQIAAVLAFLALWQSVATRGSLASSLPTPGETASALVALAGTAEFWAAVGDTLTSVGLGLAISLVVALPLGLLIGSGRFAFLSTRFTIDVLRTIPPVTLVPLVLLLYGPTLRYTLLLIVFGTIWPLLLQAIYAVREVDPVARDMARAYRLGPLLRFRALLVPSSLPFLVTGLRIAATIALLLSVTAELLGNAPGLGNEILLAQTNGLVPQVYAYVLVTALVGLAINGVLLVLQRRLLFWHGDFRRNAR